MNEVTEPETVLFESSPFGTVDAIVEQDHRAAYLYLHSRQIPSFGTRAIWIRNLMRGPLILSEEDLQLGIPPVLPRTYCSHPDGEAPLKSDRVQLIWFEEGNGVALLEDDDVIAIIPPWSGFDGFHGYARDCRTENQICWPLPQQNHLTTRIRRAAQYWEMWESNNPFQSQQPKMISNFSSYLGNKTRYFSIDGNQWPPKGLQCFEQDRLTTLTSIGMSLCSMPNVELSVDNPGAIRRAELAIQLKEPSNETIEECGSWISGAAAYPWRTLTWLGHRHTFPLSDGMRASLGNEFDSVVFVANDILDNPIEIESFYGDPVNLLWMIPIRESESNLIQKSGEENGFESVFEKLTEENRLPVVKDHGA